MKSAWSRPLVGLCCGLVVLGTFAAGATVGFNWAKDEVLPVVLVEPSIGGFSPVEGSSIGNRWSKSEVKPVLLVKPGIGGFEPMEGISIGNTWPKDEVVPVILVEPELSGFVPLGALSPAAGQPRQGVGPATSQPSIVESQIDGDFEGWEGETLIRLTNGQIWQQSEYYYEYTYSFMPKVTIYRSGGGFKMKVVGSSRAIGVKRLK